MIKVNNTKISEDKFIEVVEQFLDNIVCPDLNSQSYVAKMLIKDKLNYLKCCENPNRVARDIDSILNESFGVSFK